MAGMRAVAIALAGLLLTPASAVGQSSFITLGTGGGPAPQARRAQPANLLLSRDQAILIDCGDGAAQQLGKIDYPLEHVQNVLISHLYFDHTGGLFAFLSRRYQLLSPGVVTVYGPPGTRATVEGLLAAMEPATTAASNIRARAGKPPAESVRVIELHDGWSGRIGGVVVTAVSNSHYALQPDAPGSTKRDTYSFRFDTPDRSIAYTGDTGPSVAVERLAQNADVLISEIVDPIVAIATLKAKRQDLSPAALAVFEAHFRKQHLSPADVGLMARRAGVKSLVVTHNPLTEDGLVIAKSAIAASYDGQLTFAEDLQKF